MAGQGFDPDFIFSLPTGRMGVMEGDSAVQAIFGTQIEKHRFPFADVYIGQGKPKVAAFIDDRAVNCSPQYDANAFKEAEKNVRAILKRKPSTAKVKEPKFNIRRGKVE